MLLADINHSLAYFLQRSEACYIVLLVFYYWNVRIGMDFRDLIRSIQEGGYLEFDPDLCQAAVEEVNHFPAVQKGNRAKHVKKARKRRL